RSSALLRRRTFGTRVRAPRILGRRRTRTAVGAPARRFGGVPRRPPDAAEGLQAHRRGVPRRRGAVDVGGSAGLLAPRVGARGSSPRGRSPALDGGPGRHVCPPGALVEAHRGAAPRTHSTVGTGHGGIRVPSTVPRPRGRRLRWPKSSSSTRI